MSVVWWRFWGGARELLTWYFTSLGSHSAGIHRRARLGGRDSPRACLRACAGLPLPAVGSNFGRCGIDYALLCYITTSIGIGWLREKLELPADTGGLSDISLLWIHNYGFPKVLTFWFVRHGRL